MLPEPELQVALRDKGKKACWKLSHADLGTALLAYVCNSDMWQLTAYTPVAANMALGAAMRELSPARWQFRLGCTERHA
eukprot:12832233-Alexandrium_andersonii.AAC.1